MTGRARQNQPECQVLFELFGSPRGKVSLGRLSTGKEAGRIVMLREIREGALPQVTPAFELAKGLTHPRLLKLLGVVSDRTHNYVASEYVPGLSLFELVARARARQQGLSVGAAVRVMIDALRAVVSARSLLAEAGAQPVRLLNSDCIWLVDYGETLLSEVGVSAALLGGASPVTPVQASEVEARDMMTAAVELYQLASGRLMTGDLSRAAKLHLPAPLAKVLEDVFTWSPSTDVDGLSQLADALSGLPPVLVGSEQLVATELQRSSGDLLEERRRKLAAFHSGAGADTEGATRVFVALPVEEEEAAEEATLAVPGFRRQVPFMLAVPPLSTVTRAEPESKSRRPRPSSSQPLSAQAPKQRSGSLLFGLSRRERWLLAVWCLLALGGIAWQRRDWLSSALARLSAWKATAANQRPARAAPAE
ncbi:MAG TPA: hypothetical protein VJV79_04710 [Polyangiaceae bacterium]|nr:hypothetical protein [Polyangiaceae bacterium]